MNILLDTHIFLWLVSSPTAIDADVLTGLSDSETGRGFAATSLSRPVTRRSSYAALVPVTLV